MKNVYTLLTFCSVLFVSAANAQFKPTEAARGFSIFVKNDVTFKAGKSTSAVAMGGNAILAGQGDVAESSTGSYPYGLNNYNNYGMVVGGKMILQSGSYGNLKNGYIRVGNTTGVSPIYYDCYNPGQLRTLRIVPYSSLSDGNVCNNALNQTPRWELQRTQADLVTLPSGLNFDSSFTVLGEVSAKMAKYQSGAEGTSGINFPSIYYASQWEQTNKVNPRISLVSGKTNVLNFTGADLQTLQYLIFETQPDANTPLVINVNQAGSFTWNAGNFDRLQDYHGAYIIYNFYNNTGTISITGSNAIRGSVLAPYANIEDTHNNYIYGQLIAKSYLLNNWTGISFQQYSPTLPEVAVTPAAPGISATNITHNSFTAQWSSVANALSYKIDVSTSPNFTAGTLLSGLSNLSVSGLSKSITGLQENTDYYFRVLSVNGLLSSSYSNIVHVVTNYNPVTTLYQAKTSGNFSDASVWQYNLNQSAFRDTTALPLSTNKIEVLGGVVLNMDVDYTVAAGATFVLDNLAKLVCKAGKTLTIAGSADFNGQDVTFKSDATGTARLGELTGTLLGATNVSVERYVNAGRRWRMLTAPINGTTINKAWQEGKTWSGSTANAATFTGTLITGQQQGSAAKANANGFDYWSAISNSSSSILAFSKTTGSAGKWVTMPNTNGNFDGATAYMVFIRGDRSFSTGSSAAYTVLQARGILKDAFKTVTTPVTPGGINLLGNPFASPIEFDKFYAANSAVIQKKFWLWDANLGTYGSFRYVEGTSNGYESIPAKMGTSSDPDGTDYRFIESGQAFFVMPAASVATTQDVTFAQNQKTTKKPSTSVFRNGNGMDEQLYVNLNLVSSTGVTVADGVKAKFNEDYTLATDDENTVKTANMYEGLSIAGSGKDLTVQARPLIQSTDTIALKLSGTSARSYQLQIKAANFFSSGLIAFLYDNYLGTSTPIDLYGDVTTIDFTVTSAAASTGADRFKIVFSAAKTLPVVLKDVKAYRNQQQVNVEWNIETESGMQKYEVERSADGRSFTKQAETAAKNNGLALSYNWIDATPVNGTNYYRIKMISSNGEYKYSEIVAVKMTGTKAEVAVYPNPVTNGVISLQMNNLDKGTYSLQLIDAAGRQVINQSISHRGGSATQTVSLGSYTAPGVYKMLVTSGTATYAQTVLVK